MHRKCIKNFIKKIDISKYRNIEISKGIASLVSILILSGIFLLAGLLILNLTFTDNLIISAKTGSDKAFFIAEAGAYEAMMKIAKNKDYQSSLDSNCVSSNPPCAANYCKINILDGSACFSVSGVLPTKTIISSGVAGNKNRKIQINVSFDSGNYGKIISTNWQEIE